MTRRNPAFGPAAPNPAAPAFQAFTRTHWGIEPQRVAQLRDPDLPPEVSRMGELVEIEGEGGLLIRGDTACHLVHDPGPAQKLYLMLSQAARQACRRQLWGRRAAPLALQEAQEQAGGRQARYPHRCPGLPVQVLGRANAVSYFTVKNGDDEEQEGVEYRHALGEEGGVRPLLCVDNQGRLWLAGGSYTVPAPGITR